MGAGAGQTHKLQPLRRPQGVNTRPGPHRQGHRCPRGLRPLHPPLPSRRGGARPRILPTSAGLLPRAQSTRERGTQRPSQRGFESRGAHPPCFWAPRAGKAALPPLGVGTAQAQPPGRPALRTDRQGVAARLRPRSSPRAPGPWGLVPPTLHSPLPTPGPRSPGKTPVSLSGLGAPQGRE